MPRIPAMLDEDERQRLQAWQDTGNAVGGAVRAVLAVVAIGFGICLWLYIRR